MSKDFDAELRSSLYIHRPLPLHRERSLEGRFPIKKVTASRTLYGPECHICEPAATGTGILINNGETIMLSAPLRAGKWPEGAPSDGDYCNFGTAGIEFALSAENWESYNRIRFRVKPVIRGARIAHLNVSVVNKGEVPLPDPYFREGATVFDVDTGEWKECIWEFAAMPRDAITALKFYVLCSGHDICADDHLEYEFADIRLENIEEPEHEIGWMNPNKGIRLSTAGYWCNGAKTAIATVDSDTFEVIGAEDQKIVLSGKVGHVQNENGSFCVLDFSSLREEGTYYLRCGDVASCEFEVSDRPQRESVWKVLNFFFCERCGFPVPGKHGTCHQDILARHDGKTVIFAGGWHDAGDVSQQAAQTGEIVQCLFENAMRCSSDEMLKLRLFEEAQWGLDFILRTRFGDGYRATSAGATRITDNYIGTFDDIAARVHDHSYENFLFAGIEAFAAEALAGYDDRLASNALEAAKEDFGYAMEVFAKTGVAPAQMYEHTYNSGLSQYYAVIVWSASCIYAVTHDEDYAFQAREFADRLLECQETSDEAPLKGFFYRDETHRAIVHFNHQSREHQFIQALEKLCLTQPDAPGKKSYEQAIRLYGEYIKAIAGKCAPYGMLPAGLHRLDEADDSELFPYMHITCDYAAEKENYIKQLKAGSDIGGGFVLRAFPVWFSFRGNSAVMLSAGKAAAIAGNYLDDEELIEIAREQLYWMWGKNPFGQSLVYGAGSDYCRQYAVLCGECVGEVPVGVETLDNSDEPYWPQNNNATFREVWIGAASRFMMLCSEFSM